MFAWHKFLSIVFILVISITSVFLFDNFAIKKELQFRPLANGWVSIYPVIHLDDSLSLVGRMKKVVQADLVHGRFRPAFFTYVSTAYFLSPLIHHRLSEKPERSHKDLMTGDLRIFSYILLISVVTSMVMVSLLIYRFTGTAIFTAIPIFFIPLSPSLTENLLQNYIDSQAIPLVLWSACWLFFFFLSMKGVQKGWTRFFSRFCAFLALSLFFLTKETSIIVVGVLAILLVLLFFRTKFDPLSFDKNDYVFLISTFVYSVFFAGIIILITMLYKTGYAAAYDMDFARVRLSAVSWWNCMSRFSINNFYGFLPVGAAVIAFVINGNKEINSIPAVYHVCLFVSLLSLAYGFLTILVPWEPILIKYTYPSVFFFSFLVGYSLSLLYAMAKGCSSSSVKYLILCSLVGYAVLYYSILPGAVRSRNIDSQGANYGVSTIPQLAKNIQDKVEQNGKKITDVMVVNQAGEKWRNSIPWNRLQLKRWLNLDGNFNIVDRNHKPQKNLFMPKAELTSFRFSDENQGIYLSTKKKELKSRTFDIVYLAFLENEKPLEKISSPDQQYLLSQVVVRYSTNTPYQSFIIYQYLPCLPNGKNDYDQALGLTDALQK